MRKLVALFILTAAAVASAWWWLGRPLTAPAAATDPGRIQCMSYTPFRGEESPLDAATRAGAAQIEEDLSKLARLTGCVRTYATDNGLDQVPAIAQRLGIKVLQGLWLSRDRQKNRVQIDTAIALGKRYPDTITGIVVGNEVLLRGELAVEDIAAVLREVKAATGMPVTYADVWEFWLRNRELAAAVDFITIHILPYWEDFPIAADIAAAHVDDIRSRVAATFPGKEILIGEVGWPSAGRMREGALPSRSNQAHVLEEVMARARAKGYRVNLIEAFDQPWKRYLEGTVGGYWGLFGSDVREPKFAWGEPVSDHRWWVWQLALGSMLTAVVFTAAIRAGGPSIAKAPGRVLAGIAGIGLVAGVAVPWGLENIAIESLGPGGWIRGAAFAAVALAAPVLAAMTLAANEVVPGFARVLGRQLVGADLSSDRVVGTPSPLVGEGWGGESRGCGSVLPPLPTAALSRSPAEPRYSEGSATQRSDRNRQQPTSIGGGEEFVAPPPLNLAQQRLSPLAKASGLVLVVATVLAIQTALGLVFDPRYRDFTDPQLLAAVVPFAITMVLGVRRAGARGRAETIAAVTLAGSAVYIVLNEGFANWQALWFGAVLAVLAFTIDRLRGAQST